MKIKCIEMFLVEIQFCSHVDYAKPHNFTTPILFRQYIPDDLRASCKSNQINEYKQGRITINKVCNFHILYKQLCSVKNHTPFCPCQ